MIYGQGIPINAGFLPPEKRVRFSGKNFLLCMAFSDFCLSMEDAARYRCFTKWDVRQIKKYRWFLGPSVFFYWFALWSLSEEYSTPNRISAVPARNSGVIFSCRIRMPSPMEASG